ncbi:homoserine kinase [Phytoactinopolyspora mesophila]|uniref:Homoserine kinase n=1 Tax=Phytoactinopolyspora mesophila TaxID=2650750 RepID=A0A7K3M8R2_9ACTN|nr:homoserine kinase [Phytoactinopolyspora mesophila]NDL59716.1 homoserine kinase [Phytoactinopolyspora mesophila]
MNSSTHSVRVRVPATSANLGPGFDTFGLALGRYDTIDVRAEFSAGGGRYEESWPPSLAVSIEGEAAAEVPRDDSHLVVRAMGACFAELDAAPVHLELSCRNTLPHGRGLGSSAGAIVAGILAARALADAAGTDGERLTDHQVLALASRLEGHPDNVAPCLAGGFTIAWTSESGEVRVARTDVHPDIRAVVCVPSAPVSTETARGLLPSSVPHRDAVHNAGRAALLVEAMTRRPELLFDATEDRLHQVYREPAMPASIALMAGLRERGLPAMVSGAGPTVLVLTSEDGVGLVRREASGWDVWELPVDAEGATFESSPPNVVLNTG